MVRKSQRLQRKSSGTANSQQPVEFPNPFQDGYGDFYFTVIKPKPGCGYGRVRHRRDPEIPRPHQDVKHKPAFHLFLRLPHEIRILVYKWALGPSRGSEDGSMVVTLEDSKVLRFPGRGEYKMCFDVSMLSPFDGPLQWCPDAQTILALSRTCRAVRAELGRHLWSNAALIMKSANPDVLQRFIDHQPSAIEGIKSLQFDIIRWPDAKPDPAEKLPAFVELASATLDLHRLVVKAARRADEVESFLAVNMGAHWVRAFKSIRTKSFTVEVELRDEDDTLGSPRDLYPECEADVTELAEIVEEQERLQSILTAFLLPTSLKPTVEQQYMAERLW